MRVIQGSFRGPSAALEDRATVNRYEINARRKKLKINYYLIAEA